MTNFFQTFIESLPAQGLVVDLGAGIGKQAEQLAAKGLKVIAVDRKFGPNTLPNPNIEYQEMSVEDWIASPNGEVTANGWLLKNIVQFIDKDFVFTQLLPHIQDHTAHGGVVAIETFTKSPEPPFDNPHKNYYSQDELTSAFAGWEILLAEEAIDAGKDLQGNERTFFLSRLIARKP